MTVLTNAHTHIELNWLSRLCPGVAGTPFVDWIKDLIQARWDLGEHWEPAYEAAVEDSILELLSAGTTHVGDITATGKSIGPLLASGLKGIVYVEVLGLDPTRAAENLARARAIIDEWRPKERADLRVGLTIHTPYSVHPSLWAQALDYARRESLPLCIHAAETRAEFDYLMHGTGPLADDYYPGLNLPPVPVPRRAPIHYLEDLGALDLSPLLVHAVHVTEEDILRLAAHECSVVHCPRSNLRLQSGRMPLEAYLTAGVPVYLGTDSRASAPSLNIRDELEVAVALHHNRVPAETIASLVSRPFPAAPDDGDD